MGNNIDLQPPGDVSIERSRVAASVRSLARLGAAPPRLDTSVVVLAGDAECLASQNGATMLRTALRLLPRIARRVLVVFPYSAAIAQLAVEARGIADEIAFDTPIDFADLLPADDAAMLWIGKSPPANRNAINIWSDGWLVHVMAAGSAGDVPCQDNAIAAVAAAALGVSEIFKRLTGISQSIRPPIVELSWSLDTYDAERTERGPHLPAILDLNGLLVGAGAIGNGVILMLEELSHSLSLRGQFAVLDRQTFGAENWGTCVLIDPRAVGKEKAAWVVDRLRATLARTPTHTMELQAYVGDIQEYLTVLDPKIPPVVLSGVDEADARRLLQTWWPDLVIDAALGEIEVNISRHPVDGPDACLRCRYEPTIRAESSESLVERLTGMPKAIQELGDVVITQQLIETLDESTRVRLTPLLGRRTCAVASEATMQALRDGSALGFSPSLPFVGTLAGAMLVAEWIKYAGGIGAPVDGRWQMDMLAGPHRGFTNPMNRRSSCDCVRRRSSIEAARRARSPGGAKP